MTIKLENMGAIIGWKHSNQEGMKTSDGKIVAFPGGIPSDSDINTWKAEYEAHLAATAYREKRAAEYPAVGDQLDDLYHKGAFSDAMAAKLKAVKDKYAKPE